MCKISLPISSVLRHRHTHGEGCQQPDLQLIEPVEMRRHFCSLIMNSYLTVLVQVVNKYSIVDWLLGNQLKKRNLMQVTNLLDIHTREELYQWFLKSHDKGGKLVN